MTRCLIKFLVAVLVLAGWVCANAQMTYVTTNYADAFLAVGPPGTNLTALNFGRAGTLAVVPANSPKGEFQSILKFNLSGATNLFNNAYGASNWTVSSISLQLTSNDGGAGETPDNAIFPTITGGLFVIEWLSNDNWVEGTGAPKQPTTDGVTYNSLPTLLSGAHDILSTNLYTPPGDNIPVAYALPLDTNLVNDIAQGGDVTLLFYAADNQIAYLFNSHNFGNGNEPMIKIVAMPPPPRFLFGAFTNGNFRLTAMGQSFQQYQVQSISDLTTTNWQNLGIVTAGNTGMIQFDDTNAASPTQRFYRLSTTNLTSN